MNSDDKHTTVTKIFTKVGEDVMKGPDRPAPKTARREPLFSAGLPWTQDERRSSKAKSERLGQEAVHLVIRPGAPTIAEIITLEGGRARSTSFLTVVLLPNLRLGLADQDGRGVTTLRNGQLRHDSCRLDMETASERGTDIVWALFEKHAAAELGDDILLNEVGFRQEFVSQVVGSRQSAGDPGRRTGGSELLQTFLSGATALLYRGSPKTFTKMKVLVSGGQLMTIEALELLNADAKVGETYIWLDFGDDIAAGPVGATFIDINETGADLIVGCRLWMADPEAPLVVTHEHPHGDTAHYRLVNGWPRRFPGQPAPDLREGHAIAIKAIAEARREVVSLMRPGTPGPA